MRREINSTDSRPKKIPGFNFFPATSRSGAKKFATERRFSYR